MRNEVVEGPADAHWAQMIEQCCGMQDWSCRVPAKAVHRHAQKNRRADTLSGPRDERQRLRERLPVVAGLLVKRRADLLSEQEVECYVALGWMEWQGGALRLTTVGCNLCLQPSDFTP